MGRSVLPSGLRSEAMGGSRRDKWFLGSTAAAAAAVVVVLFGLVPPLVALRPLRERDSAAGGGSWGDEVCFLPFLASQFDDFRVLDCNDGFLGILEYKEP